VNELIMQMSWKEIMLRMSVAMLAILFASNSCSHINKRLGLKDDNSIETRIEEMIESQTGLDIDLTPNNPDEDEYRTESRKKNQSLDSCTPRRKKKLDMHM